MERDGKIKKGNKNIAYTGILILSLDFYMTIN